MLERRKPQLDTFDQQRMASLPAYPSPSFAEQKGTITNGLDTDRRTAHDVYQTTTATLDQYPLVNGYEHPKVTTAKYAALKGLTDANTQALHSYSAALEDARATTLPAENEVRLQRAEVFNHADGTLSWKTIFPKLSFVFSKFRLGFKETTHPGYTLFTLGEKHQAGKAFWHTQADAILNGSAGAIVGATFGALSGFVLSGFNLLGAAGGAVLGAKVAGIIAAGATEIVSRLSYAAGSLSNKNSAQTATPQAA